MCHMSHVMCDVSCVTFHMSHFCSSFLFSSDKVLKLVGGGSVINGATSSSFIYYESPACGPSLCVKMLRVQSIYIKN